MISDYQCLTGHYCGLDGHYFLKFWSQLYKYSINPLINFIENKHIELIFWLKYFSVLYFCCTVYIDVCVIDNTWYEDQANQTADYPVNPGLIKLGGKHPYNFQLCLMLVK